MGEHTGTRRVKFLKVGYLRKFFGLFGVNETVDSKILTFNSNFCEIKTFNQGPRWVSSAKEIRGYKSCDTVCFSSFIRFSGSRQRLVCFVSDANSVVSLFLAKSSIQGVD